MDDETDIRNRVEKSLYELHHESGLPLPVFLGKERTEQLRDLTVKEILGSGSDMAKYAVPSYLNNIIVHQGFGTFEPGSDGKLRVKLR
jgi:hypothetical protein